MTFRRRPWAPIAVLGAIAAGCIPVAPGALGGLAAGMAMGSLQRPERASTALPIVASALEAIEREHVERVDRRTLIRAALARLGHGCDAAIETVTQSDADMAIWMERIAGARDALAPCLPPDARGDLAAYQYAVVTCMVESLGTRSTFLPPAQLADVEADVKERRGGVGLQIRRTDSGIVVVEPIERSPAARADVQPGDRLIAIDGSSLDRDDLAAAVRRLRGARGSTVTLTFESPERRTRTVELVREDIVLPVPTAQWTRPRIGYVRIRQFDGETATHVARALDAIAAVDGAAVVLDLRGNSGGLLVAALATAALFVEPSATLAVVRERVPRAPVEPYALDPLPDGRRRYRSPAAHDHLPGRRIVVLVDHDTSAAAELVASALRDDRRATLVGAATNGNGTVATMIPVGTDSAVRLATGELFTPLGAPLSGPGLVPDVVVDGHARGRAAPSADATLDRAVELLSAT